MSVTTRIEHALLELDGAAYQKLCDSYLRREGYRDLEPFGSRPGSNKTRRGTPDSYATLPDGRFVFIEYTTQKDQTFAKLSSDFDKCVDVQATGVPRSQVAEVILFHTGRLAAHERATLIAKATEAEVLLRLVSVEQLAHELNDRHRQLVYDALGIELDTRQLLAVDDFAVAAGASRFATSLDVPFRFRDETLRTAASVLARGGVVVLTGHPGVGKTRLALEACRTFATAHPDALVRCLFNRGLDLFQELQQLLASPKQLLLFVDDANRFGGLDALLQLVEEVRLRDSDVAARPEHASRPVAERHLTAETSDQPSTGGRRTVGRDASRVSLIFTVRDYARDQVLQHLRQRSRVSTDVNELEIGPLNEADIATLLEMAFGIRNGHFIERIQEVARGNARLAMMAGQVAVKQQTLDSIHDVTALYDQYFDAIREDLGELSSRRPLLVAACVAFFRTVDGENERQMAAVESAFGVTVDEFWREVKRLHDMELVDMHGTVAVKMSDQVLGTYLFHLALFRQRVISVDVLLEGTFATFPARLKDAIHGALNAFAAPTIIEALQPTVERMWAAAHDRGDDTSIDALIKGFWFVLPDATLAEISRWVTALPDEREEVPVAITADAGASAVSAAPRVGRVASSVRVEEHTELPFRIEILPVFRTYSEALTRIAVGIVCDYLEKHPARAGGVLHLFANGFGFRHDSALYGFVAERAVADEVLRREALGSPLFARVAIGLCVAFLQIEFESHSSDGRSLRIWRFGIDQRQGAEALRTALWNTLVRLRAEPDLAPDVREFLVSYARGLAKPALSGEAATGVVATDAPHVFALVATLDPHALADCFLARDIMFALAGWKVRVPAALTRRFRHGDIVLAEHLYDRWHRHYNGKWRDRERVHRRKLYALAGDLSVDEFLSFFRRVSRVHAAAAECGQDRNDWYVQSRLTALLCDIAEQRPTEYSAILDLYVAAGEPASLPPGSLLDGLIRVVGADETYAFIVRLPEHARARWEGAFFSVLPEQDVSRVRTARLLALFDAAPLEYLPVYRDAITRYRSVEPAVLRRMVSALVERAKGEDPASRLLSWLLMGFHEALEILREDFVCDPRLLGRAYLTADAARDHFDFDGVLFDLVTDLDPEFPLLYLDHAHSSEDARFRFDDHRDYSRLWTREDAHALMTRIARYLAEHKQDRAGPYTWLAQLFVRREQGNAVVEATQDAWLSAMIANYATDRAMMDLLFRSTTTLADNRRRAMFAVFLKHNTSLDAFQALPLRHWMQTATGSWVPVEERQRAFLESLMTLCDRPALLSHREYLVEHIARQRRHIATEKKQDFLE